MALSLCIVPSAAAGANVTMEVAPPEGKTLTTLSKGDEVKVTVKNSAMTVNSFTCGFDFDADIFECISIEGGIELDKSKIYLVMTDGGLSPYALCDASTTAEANNNKKVGFARGSATEVKYNAGTLAIVTFKVKKVGTASFKLYESSDGSNGFNGTNIVVTNTETLAGPYTGTVTVPEDSDLTITNTSVVVSNPAAGHEYALTKKGEAAPSIYTSTAPIKFDGLTSETEYTLYVRVKGTSDHQASDASTKDIKTLSKPALPSSASVSISGTSKIGQPLTATPNLPTDAGALTYHWYRVDTAGAATLIPSAAGDSYTPSTKDDVGKKIKVVVTAENYSGNKEATTTGAVAKAAYTGAAPTEKPAVLSVTDTKVTAKPSTVLNCYGVTSASETTPPSSWTMSGVISSLNPDTEYKLWGCIVSDTVENSPATWVVFTTTKSPVDATTEATLRGSHTPYTGTYDGTAHNAFSSLTSLPSGWSIAGYSRTETGTYNTTMPKVTNVADSGKVYVKFSHTSYADVIAEYDVTVSAKNISGAVITLGTQKTYNGSEQGVQIASVKDGTASLIAGGHDYSIVSDGTATNVGNNTLVIEGKGNYKGTASATWSLVAKDVTITPDAKSKTYGAAEPELTYSTDLTAGSALETAFNTAKSGALSYTGTDVGAYIIGIGTLKAGKNFNLKMNATAVFFTINQATPVITATTPRQLVNNGMEVDISNWASFTNTDSSATLTYTLDTAPAGITLVGNKLKAASSVAAGSSFDIKVNAYGTHNFTAPAEFTITVNVVNKVDADVRITTPPASKTYGDADFTLTATKSDSAPDGGTWSWSSSNTAILEIVSDADTATPTIKVKKADTTGATLTVTYTTDTHYGSASAPITVAPKTLTAADLTYSSPITKVYDGSDNAPTGLTVSVKSDSLVSGDTLPVTGTLKYNSANVNAANEITFIPTAITTGNYTLAATEVLTITGAKITAKDVKLTGGINATDRSYVKDNKTVSLTKGALAFDGLVSGETLDVNIPATGTISDAKVGTYNVTYSGVTLVDGTGKASNYKLVGSLPTVTVTIAQAATPAAPTGLTGVKDQLLSTVSLAAHPGWSWANPSQSMNATGSQSFTANYTDPNGNYAPGTGISVVVEVSAKTDVSGSITFADGTLTYNGAGQKYEKATTSTTAAGTPVWTYTYAPADATASLDSAGLPKTAGTYTVTAKYEDDAHIGTQNATLTINKATPTGAPKYTAITTSGKTLADAGLTVTGGTFSVPGAVKWVDDAGADLADTTPVTANTYYKWLFTPTETANYNTHTGSIKLYAKSSGGGGGGSYTPSYTVSVDKTENGTITVSPKSASKGDTVTITVKPDKGYELEMLKALDKDGDALKLTEKNGKYTFTMPTGKVTVKGSFVEEAPVQIFKDVPTDAYYYEAVKWAAEKGITGGVGNGLFAPNQPCTRAQIVTFLWRAAGSPAPKNMSSFADVPADAFYAKAVAWAVENGITGGTGDGKFSPDATCTRAQSVTFLYRAAGSPKVSGSAEFGDVATNAYYADAVAWAAKNGITGGIGGGLFGSGNDCTRAQIVTFLYRNYQSK